MTLEREPVEAWRRLQQPGLSAHERDRRAILAMAGPYRVSFDFLEVVRHEPSLKPDAPYQSWGTEYVFVAEDRPDFIALQHVLVMRVQMETARRASRWSCAIGARNGATRRRIFSPTRVRISWARRTVPAEERRGAWVQSVLQVDDSPRYAARGRWKHEGSVSTWISRRNLASAAAARVQRAQGLRRAGRHQPPHHHAAGLGAGGEQPQARAEVKKAAFSRREYGVARYERIRDYDFGPGETYYKRTEPFWAEVRAAWRELEEGRGRFAMRAPADQGQLFIPFFEYAQKLADGAAFEREAARAFVRRTLQERYLNPP